ncbi:MAG: hypothetical protein ACK4UO_06420 [Pseudolabrys sp.]
MRRFFTSFIIVALLGTTAYAQKRGPKPPDPEEMQKKREAEAIDREYKSTLERTQKQGAPARTDPWANMRGTDNPKR